MSNSTNVWCTDADRSLMRNVFSAVGFLFVLFCFTSVVTSTIPFFLTTTGFIVSAVVMVASIIGMYLFKKSDGFGAIMMLLFLATSAGSVCAGIVAKASPDILWNSVITGVSMFIALAAYATYSKKDFNFMGAWLFVCILGLIVMGVLNIFFLESTALRLALNYFALIIFSGCVLYDVSNIVYGRETSWVRATASLFMDLINIVLSLVGINIGD